MVRTQTCPLFRRTVLPGVHACAAPDGVTNINGHCAIRARGDRRVVVARGMPVHTYAADDRMAEAYAMVQLVDQGMAQQREVAVAFGCTPRTVRRLQARFAAGGLPSLARQPGYPTGRPRATTSRDRAIVDARKKGSSNRAIAREFGVDEKTVRKALRRAGWVEPKPVQGTLDLGPPAASAADPNLSASAPQTAIDEALPLSMDTDPADRRFDRFLAHMGMLEDAQPLFAPAPRVQGAGVLLAVPALLATGVLDCAQQTYGTLGPAFYGLRATMMTLLLMALLRIRRPEGLKEVCPVELGRVLGLDRAPEVKTIRRKLAKLAAFGRAAQFGRALLRQRAQTHGEALGFLYVDGHVRVYHGKHTLPKAHVTRLRIAMPATTDYWVNDRDGEPLLVVTAQANAGMVAVLPELLAEIKPLLGDRRATAVFDRGGWSPSLFKQLHDAGFDVLTYRKGKTSKIADDQFARHEAILDGRKVSYRLADQTVTVTTRQGMSLSMRQVTRPSDDGSHQTQILTTRTDLAAVEVAWRMFERWRQENFFKYLSEEFALDAQYDYGVEPDDAQRTVPNPARRPLDAELRKLNRELKTPEVEATLRAFLDPRLLSERPFDDAGQAILQKIQRRIEVRQLRAETPERVPVGQAVKGPVVKLTTEVKLLTNLLKMVAYQAETELCRLLAPHYKRSEDEGRTLVQTALEAPAAIEVTDSELRIRLAPLSSPHRSRAVAAVCRELDRRNVRFPGTRLRLRLAVEGVELPGEGTN